MILLGKTNMFRFNHPGEAAKLRQKYASCDNLASVVPVKDAEPSYLFYNAGWELQQLPEKYRGPFKNDVSLFIGLSEDEFLKVKDVIF